MGRGGKGDRGGGFHGKGAAAAYNDDDQPGLDLASNYAESVAGAGGSQYGSQYGDAASVAAASVGRPASVHGAPSVADVSISEAHFSEPGEFTNVDRLMNDDGLDDLKVPESSHSALEYRQRPVSTFEAIPEVEHDYGGGEFNSPAKNYSMPSYGGDTYDDHLNDHYDAPVRSTLPSTSYSPPIQRTSPRPQRTSARPQRTSPRPKPKRKIHSSRPLPAATYAPSSTNYAPSSTNYSMHADPSMNLGGISDSDDDLANVSSDSDVAIGVGGNSYSAPVTNRKFYPTRKLPKRPLQPIRQDTSGPRLNPDMYVEKPVDGDLGAGFDMMVQETTGGKPIGEEILEQNNINFEAPVHNRFNDAFAEPAQADTYNTEDLMDDVSEMRTETTTLETQLRREKSEQNRLMQTFNAFREGVANTPMARSDSGSGSQMARISELQRRNAEMRRKADQEEANHDDELMALRRKQQKESQDLTFKADMHQQELQDLKIEEESLRAQISRGGGGRARNGKSGNMNAHMATIMAELEGAETHLDSMNNELSNQRRLQSEKDRLLQHQRSMLKSQQAQINKLVGKIGPNGDITVMINGEPINVMDLLSQNGKLEAESTNWEAKLETKAQNHAALREEVQRMELELQRSQSDFRDAYQEKAAADSSLQQFQTKLQHAKSDVDRTQNMTDTQAQKMSATKSESEELQKKLQTLQSALKEITNETDGRKQSLREKEQALRLQRDKHNSSSASFQNMASQLQRQVDKLHDRTEQTKAALRLKSDKVTEADDHVKTMEAERERRGKECESTKQELHKLARLWEQHQKKLAQMRFEYGNKNQTMTDKDSKTRSALKKLRRENADQELSNMDSEKVKQYNAVVKKKVQALISELKKNTDKINETDSILQQKDDLMQKELSRANAIIKKLNAMLTELVENQKGLVGELKQVLRIDNNDQFSLAEIIGQLKERLK